MKHPATGANAQAITATATATAARPELPSNTVEQEKAADVEPSAAKEVRGASARPRHKA
jgi:hypothetical protein